jgi:hypothetical protein
MRKPEQEEAIEEVGGILDTATGGEQLDRAGGQAGRSRIQISIEETPCFESWGSADLDEVG